MALLGTLEQLQYQIPNHDNLKKGLDFLLSFDAQKEFADVTIAQNRKVEICGTDVFAIIQKYNPKSWETISFEGHKKYIDIQCVFSGEEKLLHAGIQSVSRFGEYDDEKDIHFSPVGAFSELLLQPGDACVLFPEDMHAPCMKASKDDEVYKVVVKVLA